LEKSQGKRSTDQKQVVATLTAPIRQKGDQKAKEPVYFSTCKAFREQKLSKALSL
jgi:hypothetical protein